MVGLFDRPPSTLNSGHEAAKQSFFLRLKAVTVPLLDCSRSPVSSTATQATIQLLENLQRVLEEIPNHAFNGSLANYAFFPLTSLLQPRADGINRGDRVLECTMQTLGTLVRRWRRAGMDERVRKELWTMTVLTLGGPLNSRDDGKGKAVDRTEESKLAMVDVLQTLMEPLETLEEAEKTSQGQPSPAIFPETLRAESFAPSKSILFHTLTTLLSLAADPTSLVQLQLSSLSSLRILTTQYLVSTTSPRAMGPSPLLATALPGFASTLCRTAVSKPPNSKMSFETASRKQTSSIVVEALRLLSLLVELTVSDAVTVDLREGETKRSSEPVSLERLVYDLEDPSSSPLEPQQPSDPSNSDVPSSSTGPTVPTLAWLRYTVSSFSSLLTALSPLSSHHSPSVRSALVDLLAQVVEHCSATFGTKLEGPLEGLLVLSGDEWDVVNAPARRVLLELLEGPFDTTTSATSSTTLLLGQIVHRRLTSLPLLLRKRDEEGIRRTANILRSALDILPVTDALESLVSTVPRWSWSLLGSFELERVTGAVNREGSGMMLAWVSEHQTAEGSSTLPRIRLRNLHDDSTLRSLDFLFGSFGMAAARVKKEDVVVDSFIGVALGPRRAEAVGTNALWVLEGILDGWSRFKMDKRRKKVVRGLVKAVVGLMEELESEAEEEEVNVEPSRSPAASSPALEVLEIEDLPPIQHNKGVTAMPSLSEYNPVVTRSTSMQDLASHRILLLSLALRIIAKSSTLLRESFQSLLLPSLYHVLAFSSSASHPFLRGHAQASLAIIAESTLSTSPQDLVLANVDYVVNSVSQRMSVTRLDPSAPLVLVEMIRLVGKPIVAMVQDLVDDVFEALDDFHGYEEITVGLWAVLDALLKVMEEDLPDTARDNSETAERTSDSEFDSFTAWFLRRKEAAKAGDSDPEEEELNPQKPFASTSSNDPDNMDGSSEFPEPETKELPPTRPQLVTAQILSKALYFLSHPSPFLRSRVLSLLASAVPLLARPSLESSSPENRAADLLPVIHRSWPFILNRLADSDLSVVVEAASLIESLALHVGDFMSRRIVDDVWPRFRSLLAKQELDDSTSALPKNSRYSNSHRLYRAIVNTLLHVARHVPLKEDVLWDQGVLLRRFLSTTVDEELQLITLELFRSLARINRDAIWLILMSTVERGFLGFLGMDSQNFEGGNVVTLLGDL